MRPEKSRERLQKIDGLHRSEIALELARQLPTELYIKIDHDGRDYVMIADDEIAILSNPDEVSQICRLPPDRIREVKSVLLSKPLQRADRSWTPCCLNAEEFRDHAGTGLL